jgi:hypothetical protein
MRHHRDLPVCRVLLGLEKVLVLSRQYEFVALVVDGDSGCHSAFVADLLEVDDLQRWM